MTLGGRAAAELVFGEVTTGASNDIEKVTATAKLPFSTWTLEGPYISPRSVHVPSAVTIRPRYSET